PGASPGVKYVLQSTGVYMRQALTPASMGPFTIDWEDSTFYSGNGPELLDTDTGDTLHVLGYVSTGTPGVTALGEVARAELHMQEGQQPVDFDIGSTGFPYCTNVTPSSNLDVARLRDLFPAYTVSRASGWEIDATPLADRFGIRLPFLIYSRY